MFDIGWLEKRRAQRHLYQIKWKSIGPSGASRLPILSIGYLDDLKWLWDDSIVERVASLHAFRLLLALPQCLNALPVLEAALALLQVTLIRHS